MAAIALGKCAEHGITVWEPGGCVCCAMRDAPKSRIELLLDRELVEGESVWKDSVAPVETPAVEP